MSAPAAPEPAGRGEDRADSPRLRYAERDDATFLILEGRVTWLCGQSLLDAALSVIDSGRRLIVDLGDCDYLDSTLLGTLHELVDWADRHGGALSLQRVSEALRDAFRELSMTSVLARIADRAEPVPGQQHTVRLPEHSHAAHRQRLMRAHEVLSELSEENRTEFAAVLEALRNENSGGERE